MGNFVAFDIDRILHLPFFPSLDPHCLMADVPPTDFE